ncbi:hypothetical protein HPG69_001721 [Diceros bicornis minor]|uniref:CD276 antigen n=1 Tax=Diceros bicornis minor TaxID=77932 RepID=A0A7J7FBF3_DICBM|nr:hypothetical protein HPG69_001721 [Diceros bicornis minor]
MDTCISINILIIDFAKYPQDLFHADIKNDQVDHEPKGVPTPPHRPTPPPPGTAVEVQVPEDPVVALVGTDATLRCSFSPEPDFSLAQLNLIWQLTDTKQLVHSFAEGRDQGSGYANRTALFPDLLAQGNASLRLQRVRVADEGSFTCFVSIRDFGSAAVSLQVAAPYSKPSMTLEPNKDLRPGDTVTITCSSYRGYPEAEVFWQDGQGAPLTGNVTTSQMANEQGLFDVRSVLKVVLGANGTYSCLVRNPVLQQDAHGSVTITGQPMTFPPEALWVTVGLSVCLVALLVALAFVCWRKIKQSCEEENAGEWWGVYVCAHVCGFGPAASETLCKQRRALCFRSQAGAEPSMGSVRGEAPDLARPRRWLLSGRLVLVGRLDPPYCPVYRGCPFCRMSLFLHFWIQSHDAKD